MLTNNGAGTIFRGPYKRVLEILDSRAYAGARCETPRFPDFHKAPKAQAPVLNPNPLRAKFYCQSNVEF